MASLIVKDLREKVGEVEDPQLMMFTSWDW